MEADREGQRAGAAQRKAHEQAQQTGGDEVFPDMRRIFFDSRGLRAGWRLLIFVGIFVGLGFLAN